RLGLQDVAQSMLALATTVPGRSVEVADPGHVSGLDRRGRARLVDDRPGIAERRAAEAEAGHLQFRATDPAERQGLHTFTSSRGASDRAAASAAPVEYNCSAGPRLEGAAGDETG